MPKFDITRFFPASLKPLVKRHENSVIFVLRLAVLFFAWQLLFHFIWKNSYLFDIYYAVCIWIIDSILHCCEFVMYLLGMDAEVHSATRVVRIVGTPGVTVGEPCIGIDLMALYIALIVSSRGAIKKKLWYIPVGVFGIFCLNVARIISLAVLVTIDYDLWEINHIFVFTAIVYIFTFIMWHRWLKISRITTPSV
ncbi:MAG: exosortase/archaeosortase family protein [Crocinitomicaceae bacterium]|nr:exosortase/archaeosortase family protein [Crocinitomicaceae bacterium]